MAEIAGARGGDTQQQQTCEEGFFPHSFAPLFLTGLVKTYSTSGAGVLQTLCPYIPFWARDCW